MSDRSWAATVTIGEFARRAGVGVETVRFYQRRGLLAVPVGGDGPRRYGSDDLSRLHFVRAAQRAGFTLTEVAQLLAFDRVNDRASAHAMAKRRIAALDEKIAALEASRDTLRELAARCASGEDGPCPILQAFETGRRDDAG